ncbi:MAG: hypothetical protein ACXW1T_09075 [Methylophilus sp.]
MVNHTQHSCPQCGGYILRVPRRISDRIFSIFSTVHRYRCQYFPCQWEGNIRVHNHSNSQYLKTANLQRPLSEADRELLR